MSIFIKLDPTKPFEVPKGCRVGKVIINGEYRERTNEMLEKTNRDDDNIFIRKLQKTMYHRAIEWLKKKGN